MERKLGLVHRPRPGTVKLATVASLEAAGTPDEEVNYHAPIRMGDPIGNDIAGNCVEAGILRLAQMRMANAWGSAWEPSAKQALDLYTAWTGWRPEIPATDQGTGLDVAMLEWSRHGIKLFPQVEDVAIPVSIDPNNPAEFRYGLKWFGGVGISFALPLFVKFDKDEDPWTVPPPELQSILGAPGGWGMHFVPSGRIASGGIYVITWGIEKFVTWDFLRAYAVSIDTGVSRLWLNAKGMSPPGFDYDQLRARALTL